MSATCRSCGASLLWAFTTNGNPIPVDAEPNPAGNLFLRTELDGTFRALIVGRDVNFEGLKRHMPHHASCPEGGEWRRR